MGFSAGRVEVTTTVKVSATVPAQGNAPGNSLPTPTNQPSGTATQSLTFGTSSGKVNVFCVGQYIIAASSSLTLNLYDGGVTTSDLTTVFGAAANLRNVKQLSVRVVDGGSTSGVSVGAAAANPWAGFFGDTSDIVKVFPSGIPLTLGSPDGVTVTSTTKNLKLANNSTTASVTVEVFVNGTTVEAGYAMGVLGLTYA